MLKTESRKTRDFDEKISSSSLRDTRIRTKNAFNPRHKNARLIGSEHKTLVFIQHLDA